MKLYYWITAYIPRKLPRNLQELNELKDILFKYFDVPCEANEILTIYGQLQSVPASSMRRSWGRIANAAKRLAINKLVQEEKLAEIKKLEARLEEIAKNYEYGNNEHKPTDDRVPAEQPPGEQIKFQ